MTLLLIILCFFVYAVIGAYLCYKVGIVDFDTDNTFDIFVESLFIVFWPITMIGYLVSLDV